MSTGKQQTVQPLIECSFLIPVHRDKTLSDGELHFPEAWAWLRDQLHDRFGGVTFAPGLYEGSWKKPVTGEVVSDQSRRYIVAVPSEQLDGVREILTSACKVFCQQCIYLSIAGQVEFIEGDPDVSAYN
jgi:hypothetical protein